MTQTIGAAATAAFCLAVSLAGCRPPTAPAPLTNPVAGVTFVGEKGHPVKIFHLSADGRAAVGYVFDVDKEPPPGSEALDGGMPAYAHSFRWTEAGGVKVIRTRDGRDVQVEAISADGTTASGCFFEATGPAHVFRWTEAGGVEDLGSTWPALKPLILPPGMCSTTTAVSTDGSVILGQYHGGSFRWARGTGFRNLHIPAEIEVASADGAAAAGVQYVEEGHDRVKQHVFRWSLARGFEDLGVPAMSTAGYTDVSVAAMSADGSTIVGNYTPHEGPQADRQRAFRWTRAGGFEDLPGDGGTASAVSGDGSQIVGSVWAKGKGPHAVRWLGDSPPQLIGPPELQTMTATSISADGRTIAGRAFIRKGEFRSFLLKVK